MVQGIPWLTGWDREPVVDRPVRVIGIDLGTTTSTITEIVWDPRSGEDPVTELLEIQQRNFPVGNAIGAVVPSIVAVDDAGVEYVGIGAFKMRTSYDPAFRPRRDRNIWFEQKNHIGTRRLAPNAPDGYRTPKEIAAKILAHLYREATQGRSSQVDKVIVTVPASFQLSQRQDTLDAAEMAGIPLQGDDLLDEPVAAFVDFLATSGGDFLAPGKRSRLAVVDFGGGTDDVALLELERDADGALTVQRRAVSRFTRLGGSDLDRAIALEILLPRLIEENHLAEGVLGWKLLETRILPVLTATAEELKTALTKEYEACAELGREDPTAVYVRFGVPTVISTANPNLGDDGNLQLHDVSLSYREFAKVVKPFLSHEVMMPRLKEHGQTLSVFAPVRETLQRCQWAPSMVDHVLLVGGASRTLGLRESLQEYFGAAQLLEYEDARDVQHAVGRGAAYVALLHAAFGESPIRSVTGASVDLLTNQGRQTLVPEGLALPFPEASAASPPDVRTWSDPGYHWEVDRFRVQKGSTDSDVRVELRLSSGGSEFFSKPIDVAPPVEDGAPIRVGFRIDTNFRLLIRVEVERANGEVCSDEVPLENPYSVVANANAKHDRLEELTHNLSKAIDENDGAEAKKALKELAPLCFDLRYYARALDHYNDLLTMTGTEKEQARIYWEMADVAEAAGRTERALEFFEASFELGAVGVGLSLAIRLQSSDPERALEIIERYRRLGGSTVAALGLKSEILAALDRHDEARVARQTAVDFFMAVDDLSLLRDFELFWLRKAAKALGLTELVERIDEERKGRVSDDDDDDEEDLVEPPDGGPNIDGGEGA